MCGKGVGNGLNKLRTLMSFGHFQLILATFLRSQSYDFDVIVHAGTPWCRLTVLKSYSQFLRNLKFSSKGREKKKARVHK